MSGSTTNYAWTIPSLGENPYYTDMTSFFTSVDKEMMFKSANFSMQGYTIFGNNTASANLTVSSTSHATKGLINLGSTANAPQIDENKGVVILTPVASVAAPTNGSIWTTSAGMYVQINGSTVGPLAAANAAPLGPYTIATKSTGNNYTILTTDFCKLIIVNSANNYNLNGIPAANATISGNWIEVESIGAGTCTLNLASGNWWGATVGIGSNAMISQKTKIWCDSSNWYISPLEVLVSNPQIATAGNTGGYISQSLSTYVPVQAKRASFTVEVLASGSLSISSISTGSGNKTIASSAAASVFAVIDMPLLVPQTIWLNGVVGWYLVLDTFSF
jgi:hypothetical protein